MSSRAATVSAGYFEANVDIHADHWVHLQLPREIPEGKARIAVIYPLREDDEHNSRIKELLCSMPDVGEDTDFARDRQFGREGPEWDS